MKARFMATMNEYLIAFYLPQFHPVPENDKWWGKGFTEWHHVAKAVPLFEGHQQPRIPGELGFYDLRISETRIDQARLAMDYGVSAFCYWHYWFSGRRLLFRPFQEVLQSGEPRIQFCLAWANESWEGRWHGLSYGQRLIEQLYSSDDARSHFMFLFDAFRDDRYFHVGDRPLIYIKNPLELPVYYLDIWRDLARKLRYPDPFIIGEVDCPGEAKRMNLDRYVVVKTVGTRNLKPRNPPFLKEPYVCLYRDCDFIVVPDERFFPCVTVGWDNTPRCGIRGTVAHDVLPSDFRSQMRRARTFVSSRDRVERIIFLKSWNEWAEGNYLEPDVCYGRSYLEALMS